MKVTTVTRKMTITKNYYAVEYNNGLAVGSEGKRYLPTYHAFSSREERDEWVQGGGEFTSSPGWREAIPSSDSELRSELRLESLPAEQPRNMKICKSYKEAKKQQREFEKNGRTYSIVPPYEEIIDGVDYGEKDPQPVLVPIIIDGK